MSTHPPTPDTHTRRPRGDMYLRAEERHRAELAAEQSQRAELPTGQLTAIRTPPRHETYQSPPPATPASDIAVPNAGPGTPATTIDDMPVVAPAWMATEPLDLAAERLQKSPPTPPRGPNRRQATLIPAAVLGAVALAATLGIALTLSTGDEPQAVAIAATPPVTAPPAESTTVPPPAASSPAPAAVATPGQPAVAPAKVVTPERPTVVRTARTARTTVTAPAPARSTDGQIRITSTPPGARVTVDGIGWGQTPVTISNLPPGRKTIRLTRDGYRTQQAIVNVSGDRPTQTVSVVMSRR